MNTDMIPETIEVKPSFPPIGDGKNQLDPRIFDMEVLQLLYDNNFEIEIIPKRKVPEFICSPTTIMLDSWDDSYLFKNEELNRAIIIKNVKEFEKPAVNIMFCYLDSLRNFDDMFDTQLWKPLFTETREEEKWDRMKFGYFMKKYLLILNNREVEVFYEAYGDWRSKKYLRYLFSENDSLPKFPHKELFHIIDTE
jgi:hypothetical protein